MAPYLHLIAKKLSREIDQEEELSLQEWREAAPEHELLFHRMREVWHKARYEPSIRGQEQVFEKIATQLGITQEKPVPITSNQTSGFGNYWARVAAVLLLAVSATLVWVWYSRQQLPKQAAEEPQVIMLSKSNPRGQKSLITLPDGSQVKLNAESYLEYPQVFDRTRQVKLVGEAFFEVVRDTLHPFVVSAGDVQVRVLGTSFNVQAFPFEENMSVAVATGAVMVKKKSNTRTCQVSELHPREMLKVNHKTGAFEESSFDPDELLAWKEGVLVFHQASFEQIIHKLERWYGVDFIIRRNQPVRDGFTARYDNPSLKVVLEGMSYSSDFSYTIEGDTVIIE